MFEISMLALMRFLDLVLTSNAGFAFSTADLRRSFGAWDGIGAKSGCEHLVL